MRSMTMRKQFAVGLAAVLTLTAAACGSDDESSDAEDTGGDSTTEIKTLADLTGNKIGVQSNTTGATYAEENKPEGAEVVSFPDTSAASAALLSGQIDAILQDLPVNAGLAAENPGFTVVETYKTDEQYGFAVAKGSPLKEELNGALETVRNNGIYDAIFDKYFPTGGAEAGPGPEESDVVGTESITVCSDIPYPPMEMEGDGPRGLSYTGFDIDLMDALAAELGKNLEVRAVPWDGILGNLASGSCDVVASSVTITEEREAEVDFVGPYFDADQSLLVKG